MSRFNVPTSDLVSENFPSCIALTRGAWELGGGLLSTLIVNRLQMNKKRKTVNMFVNPFLNVFPLL